MPSLVVVRGRHWGGSTLSPWALSGEMEMLMRYYGFAIATASVVALGSLSAGRAEAAPIGAPGGMRTALNALNITEKAQV